MNTVAELRKALSDEATRLAPSGGIEDRVIRAIALDARNVDRRRTSRSPGRIDRRASSHRMLAALAALLTLVVVIALVVVAGGLRQTRTAPVNAGRPGTAVIEVIPRAFFFSPSDALVVDFEGRILVTHDGGRDWLTTKVSMMDATAWWIDSDRIVLDPWPHAIQTTTDGGAQWTVHANGAGADPSYGFFLDVEEGWTIDNNHAGSGTAVFHTTDSGSHWETLANLAPTPTIGGPIMFTDPLHGYMGGVSADGVGRYFTSLDGGRTWNLATLPRPAAGWGGASGTVGLPRFFGARGVLSYSASDGTSYTYTTSNGGATWSNPQPFPLAASTPVFADPSEGWAVDAQGREYRTSDGGQSWSRVAYALPGFVLTSVSPVGGQTLWGIARAGAGSSYAVRSDDGGITWSPVKLPAP